LDEKVQLTDDICVYVDPKAVLYLNGTKINYVEKNMVSEFTFENPNSKVREDKL
jgi:Fe-S cluster assembly iron-binding protein IscA